MCEKYYECKVKISEEDLERYLENCGWTKEDMTTFDFDSEIVDVVSELLSEQFADYYVTSKNTIEINFE